MLYFFQAYYQENSNGISCMYEMVRVLNSNGIPARIVCTQNKEFCQWYCKPLPEKYQSIYIPQETLPKELNPEDTVVIQDVYEGDIPKNANVVRWLLNKPICLTGKPIEYGPLEYVIAYSNYINDKLPQLFFLKDEQELLQGIREKCQKSEDTVSVYFGKVHLDVLHERKELLSSIVGQYKKVNVITRWNPASRVEALEMLAQSDLLVSFDPLTNVNYEACLLGTPALMLDDSFQIVKKQFNIDNSGWFLDYSELDIAKQKVKDTFLHYCEWLENQDKSTIDTIHEIVKKVECIRTDPREQEINAAWNKSLKEQDMDYYINYFNAAPFVGINTVYDLPHEIAKILEIDNYWINHIARMIRRKTVALLKSTNMMDFAMKVYHANKRS